MKKLENEILNALIDKYERSKLSKNGTKIKRSIKLTTEDEVLSTYTLVDSYKYAAENDATILALEEKGFIKCYFVKERFESLTLNLEVVDEVYAYLKRANPLNELSKISHVLSTYHFDNFINDFVIYCKDYITEKKTYPKVYFTDADNLVLILNCFEAMFSLDVQIKEREFSAKYLKDSKLFETIKRKVIKIIKDFGDGEDLDDNEILANYNISKNTSYALIKKQLIFKLNEQIIDLNKLNFEYSLSEQMIDNLIILPSGIKKVITVENLTSFYNIDEDALIVYLAGYHNHTKQKLLTKLYDCYPNAEYYHYGDIDAGGFWIFVNLVAKTKIPFKPYKMNVEQFKTSPNIKSLSNHDCQRLQAMLKDERFEVFYETINYMLINNVKLEQENLD